MYLVYGTCIHSILEKKTLLGDLGILMLNTIVRPYVHMMRNLNKNNQSKMIKEKEHGFW